MSGDEWDDDERAPSQGSAKWRCAWCDKPHTKNDPPCDNCGHHKFEKAVVPVAPEDPDHEREPVWVCPECGRVHQKNSPPCSRCGHASLEKRVPEDDFDEELETPSYVDLLEPQYVAGLAFALVAGGVLVLALLGVVTLPGMGGSLAVADVPGNATAASGVSLAETEAALVEEVNERRSDRELSALSRDDRLGAVARYVNQRRVKAAYGDGRVPDGERIREAMDGACRGGPVAPVIVDRAFEPDAAAFDSPESLAGGLLESYESNGNAYTEAPNGRIGVDVHAGPDGRLFVTAFTC
jgi:hypothetical protein